MQSNRVGRPQARALLVLWLVAGVAAVAAVSATARTGASTAVDLKFQVWSYSIPTIQSNIKRFQALNPGVKVKLSDTSWFDYHDVMATRFTGGDTPDIAYSSDHWLREWVAANWVAPNVFSRSISVIGASSRFLASTATPRCTAGRAAISSYQRFTAGYSTRSI